MVRRQNGGPARGFWQFEVGGIRGVRHSLPVLTAIGEALIDLRYPVDILDAEILQAIEHNDVLAACFARCLIYTFPGSLPPRTDPDRAWTIYTETWRPGTPRRESWNALYAEAWERTSQRRT